MIPPMSLTNCPANARRFFDAIGGAGNGTDGKKSRPSFPA
jgi:hypothetical protein